MVETTTSSQGYPFTRRRFDPKLVAPEPHEVKPDYAYLAATRILVEMNLRDILTVSDLDTFRGETGTVQKVIDALRCLELGRMGSATNFWEESWVEQRPIELDESVHHPVASSPQRSSKRKGKEKATEEKWIEGWDWAGVSGHWM
ncbi:hypothetical protein H0H93_005211 [Arthromyces matolae]|nr:hypothetical protein H0H93_005211 [Arthromyces matolae]